MKTILITGATDGIGRLATQKLAALGHRILAHGREQTETRVIDRHATDWADRAMASRSSEPIGCPGNVSANSAKQHERLDAVANNAGVLKKLLHTQTSNES